MLVETAKPFKRTHAPFVWLEAGTETDESFCDLEVRLPKPATPGEQESLNEEPEFANSFVFKNLLNWVGNEFA